MRSRAASTLLRSSTSGGPSPIIRITSRSGDWAKASDSSFSVRIFFPFTSSTIPPRDRKSTRLNSSHRTISYAVFCLIPPHPISPLFPYTTLFRSQNIVTRVDAFARGFHFVAVEHQRRSVSDHTNHQPLRRLGESFRQFIQRPNFLSVYFIHDPAAVRRQITVDRVRQK